MTEIKTDIIKLNEGELYTAGEDDYLINADHTIADIYRFIKREGWLEDFITISEMDVD
jgi:hypothetical protein